MGRTKAVGEIAALWLESVKLERGDYAAYQSRRFLIPFLARFGKAEVANVGPKELLAYRAELAGKYAVGTVNGYLMAAKRCIRWSAENEYRKPVILTGVKAVCDEREPESKAWTVEECRRLWTKAMRHGRQVYIWTAIQYMALARPSEVQRLILWKHGHNDMRVKELGEGIFSFAGKTSKKNGLPRVVIFCPEAMALFEEARPSYSCGPMSTETGWHPTFFRSWSSAIGVSLT